MYDNLIMGRNPNDSADAEQIDRMAWEGNSCIGVDGINQICGEYVDNITAYVNQCNVGDVDVPDESLMRFIEEKANIPEQAADEFRRSLLVSIDGPLRGFRWDSNQKLKVAFEKIMFHNVREALNHAQSIQIRIDQINEEAEQLLLKIIEAALS